MGLPERKKNVSHVAGIGLNGCWQQSELQELLELGTAFPWRVAQVARRVNPRVNHIPALLGLFPHLLLCSSPCPSPGASGVLALTFL